MFGEMSSMVLNSQRISAQKIQSTGFEFQYNKLSEYFQKIFS
jgi:NAD dependent epimerase/dehydratase family enzyme